MIEKNIDMLSDKYDKLFGLMLVMDEFMYLISGYGLFNAQDRIIYNRYVKIIQKCKADPSKPENCQEVCQEFNLNRFNYMWDGESKVIKYYIENYQRYWLLLLNQSY